MSTLVAAVEEKREALNGVLHSAAFLRAEQLRNFLADSSHELKTPLTVIRGFTDLVLRTKNMTEEDIKFHISSIQRETNRMISITNDLLVLSRMQAKIEFCHFLGCITTRSHLLTNLM